MVYEIEMNGQMYRFNFGMGFLKEINKTMQAPIDGVPGQKQNVGLNYALAGILDGDLEKLEDVLFLANKGQDPRLTRTMIDAHIDDPDTDIEALFEQVKDFLSSANATKKRMMQLIHVAEAQARAQNQ